MSTTHASLTVCGISAYHVAETINDFITANNYTVTNISVCCAVIDIYGWNVLWLISVLQQSRMPHVDL